MGLTYKDKMELPASLLLDPVTFRAAAYNSTHRLITESASAALVQFALNRSHRQELWNEKKQDWTGMWRPLPEWAGPGIRERCVLHWFRHGGEDDEFLAAMPRE